MNVIVKFNRFYVCTAILTLFQLYAAAQNPAVVRGIVTD
jgi:hypothetical protein